MRKLLPILMMFLLAACGGTRREGDFGGGGKITKVQVLARAVLRTASSAEWDGRVLEGRDLHAIAG